jgi:hypothetical protein
VFHSARVVVLVDGFVARGGAADSSKVTHVVFVVFVVGMLFSILSIFSNASICAIPFWFLLPLSACVRLSIAFTIVSAGIKVGWVIYLCLKNTVSDILSLLVFLT